MVRLPISLPGLCFRSHSLWRDRFIASGNAACRETRTIKTDALTIKNDALNAYRVTLPPNHAQLLYASQFFNKPPALLWSASHFRSLPDSPQPEVALLGRSNVGKSSLLNALLFGGGPSVKHPEAARTSKKPGRTMTMNGYGAKGFSRELGPAAADGKSKERWRQFPTKGGFVLVDMPGYGKGSQNAWGQEIMKYLTRRKQMRKAYVIVDAEHGMKTTDAELINALRQEGVPLQVVLSKVDKILAPRKGPVPNAGHAHNMKLKMLDEVKNSIATTLEMDPKLLDVLCVSTRMSLDPGKRNNKKAGIDELRWSLLTSCGLESNEQGQIRNRTVDNVQFQGEGIDDVISSKVPTQTTTQSLESG